MRTGLRDVIDLVPCCFVDLLSSIIPNDLHSLGQCPKSSFVVFGCRAHVTPRNILLICLKKKISC